VQNRILQATGLLPVRNNGGKPVIFRRLFVKKPDQVDRLYAAIVAAARQPMFFADWAVPDTIDGRFDILVLHMFLVLRRLKTDAPELCQQLTDHFFTAMDRDLREMGVGDLTGGKKVRKMAEAFHGRLNAYSKSIDSDEAALVLALQRNVYAGETNPQAKLLAHWVVQASIGLVKQDTTAIQQAKLVFP
jgi:cytochrome b pre-mRNA-processing protein 3